MKKPTKRKSTPTPKPEPAELEAPEVEQVEMSLGEAINEIYEKLAALENKMDTLLNRSNERSQGEGNRFERSGAHFRPSNRFGGPGRNDRSRERSFTKAVCAECGKECEVPFKPTGDRPVYCSDCFSARKDSGGGFKGPRHDKKRGSFHKRRKERF